MTFICSLWQVFLNRVSIGFLDYKTTKITIPLTQVCYSRELGDGSVGVKEEDQEARKLLN